MQGDNIQLALFVFGHSRLPDNAVSALMNHLSTAARGGEAVVPGSRFGVWELGGGFLTFPSTEEAIRCATRLAAAWCQLKLDHTVGGLIYGLSIAIDRAPHSQDTAASTYRSVFDLALLADGWAESPVGKLALSGRPDHLAISASAAAEVASHTLIIAGRPHSETSDDGTEVYEIPLTELVSDTTLKEAARFEPPMRLVYTATQNRDLLFSMSPWEFQLLVAALFEDMNYRVELQAQTRDHGIDIIAEKPRTDAQPASRYLVQCKQHRATPVGESALRDLVGAGRVLSNTGMILVTTSSFTGPSRKYAKSLDFELDLRDLSDLNAWLRAYASRRSWPTAEW